MGKHQTGQILAAAWAVFSLGMFAPSPTMAADKSLPKAVETDGKQTAPVVTPKPKSGTLSVVGRNLSGPKPDSPSRIVLTVSKTVVQNKFYNFKMDITYATQSTPIHGPATVTIDASWALAHWRSGGGVNVGTQWQEGTPTIANFIITNPVTLTIPAGTTPPTGQTIGSYTLILVDNTTPGMSAHQGPFCATAHLSTNPSGNNGQVCVNF